MFRPRFGNRPRSLLVETFSVVLGVLLALLVNDWWGERAHRQHGQRALQEVLEELGANRASLRDSYEYHAHLMRMIYTATSPPEISAFDRGFTLPATLLSTAWESARSTDALSAIDYDTVLQLARIYALQDRYALQTQAISSVIYETMLKDGREGIRQNYRNLGWIIGTFWYKEAQLGQEIDPTLRDLGVEIPQETWGPPGNAEEHRPPGDQSN